MSKESKKTDPYKFIDYFFSVAPLVQRRRYIYSMLRAAYSEDYWRISDPGSLLFFQRNMRGLIKATYLFVSKEKNKTIIKKTAILKKEAVNGTIDPVTYFGRNQGGDMWAFFPRYLSKKEFIDPYDAIKKFFEFKSLDEWLRGFNEIISYALSPYGNESALEIDYLEINKLLQKLIEATHLILIRVSKSEISDSQKKGFEVSKERSGNATMGTEDESYSNDPYKIIEEFFMDGDVQDSREDISHLFEAAFSDDLIKKRHYPATLVFAFERIIKLIDAAREINQEKQSEAIDETKIGAKILDHFKTFHKRTGKWDLFPYKLKPFEWVYPRLAINAFFEHQPISHWKGKLHEIMQAAISNQSICAIISDRSKLYMDCEQLERLVEAVWVIKVMEL